MNKYIDYLTIREYEIIVNQMKARLPELKANITNEDSKKQYIELRFIILKIEKIIQKHKKKT